MVDYCHENQKAVVHGTDADPKKDYDSRRFKIR